MRDDMAKLIVERPRLGGHGARKRRPLKDLDLARDKIGMGRAASETGDRKMLNENLAPLRRYITGQVGRPWAKVWAEICANLSVTSTVQQHVRDHISDLVAFNGVTRCGGQVLVLGRWGGPKPLETSWFEFWVEPATDILRRNRRLQTPRMKRKARRKDWQSNLRKRMVERDAQRQYHLLDDGAWWVVTLEVEPTAPAKPNYRGRVVNGKPLSLPFVDVVLRAGLSRLPRHELYGRHGVYSVAKRQLSREEAKRLKLRR